MFYAILGLVDPGDEVIYPDPGLPDLRVDDPLRRRHASPDPDPEANDFRLDVDELRVARHAADALLIFNSPANPTGGVLTRGDLERDRRRSRSSTT